MNKIVSLEMLVRCPIEIEFETKAECWDDLTDEELEEIYNIAFENYDQSLEYDYCIDEDSLKFE
jgi:hypothetical protein